MIVEIRLAANLQRLVGGQRAIKIEGSTVIELLDRLDEQYPGFKQQIISDGQLHRFVNIYLNGEDVRFLQGLDTSTNSGDEVSIVPAVAGGLH